MQLFYAPDISGDLYTLAEEESRHCLKVLRLSIGDTVYLTDGKGNLWEASIASVDGKRCSVHLRENLIALSIDTDGSQSMADSNATFANREPRTANLRQKFGFRPYHLHIAIAPTKNIERFEWFLEKATEIGIDEITPLFCERSERRHLRPDRLDKVITAAIKQSLKAWRPQLNAPEKLDVFLAKTFSGQKLIAYITSGVPLLTDIYLKGNNAVCLIGPEGDFSLPEVEQAIVAGYKTVSLGDSRLRTETAGIAACHAVSLLNMIR